jgi:hypothetical protein
MAITGIRPILNVSDVPASLAWFDSLGWPRSLIVSDDGRIEAAAVPDAHLLRASPARET